MNIEFLMTGFAVTSFVSQFFLMGRIIKLENLVAILVANQEALTDIIEGSIKRANEEKNE